MPGNCDRYILAWAKGHVFRTDVLVSYDRNYGSILSKLTYVPDHDGDCHVLANGH